MVIRQLRGYLDSKNVKTVVINYSPPCTTRANTTLAQFQPKQMVKSIITNVNLAGNLHGLEVFVAHSLTEGMKEITFNADHLQISLGCPRWLLRDL